MKLSKKLFIQYGLLIIFALSITYNNAVGQISQAKFDSVLSVVTYQYTKMIEQVVDTTKYPKSLSSKGNLTLVTSYDWTSGFFPGTLWYLYEITGDTYWKDNASKWTARIENEKNRTDSHDLGFMFYCSFGNGYRLTGKEEYKNILLTAASSLSTRYSPVVGCMDSWDWGEWASKFVVIIDNMMNLEFLYWAASATGDSSYYRMAKNHAATTQINHFRPNYSSYHLVEYNPSTGQPTNKRTYQGYSDESSWARGQSWGLYGYVMSYRKTQDTAFLHQAENIANYLLNHPRLPADMVPYWDYDAPNIPNEQKDASAGAIMCSALFELSKYSSQGETYKNKAIQILQSLMSPSYLNAKDAKKYFILDHAVGFRPANTEVNVPLIYADYYFIESLLRYKQLVLTDVKTPTVTITPVSFELSQNYPNPFNPSTVISYQLSVNSHVKLSIYNVLGMEVKTLVNEEKSVGSYEVRFDANGLSSGVYFYKIQAGEFMQSKKMLLTK